MIVNGRPYTNENGFVDDGLITDDDPKLWLNYKTISDWIKKNFRPNKNSVCPSSSYGLKHLLQEETNIYLTNNQFKDAMWLAGYYPIDPDELNWHYNLDFIPWVKIENPNPFLQWLKQFEEDEGADYERFIHDCLDDSDFPIFAEKEILDQYASSWCSYFRGYLDIFWERYTKYLVALKGTTSEEVANDSE